MKNIKALPISIATIILVAFLAVSFLIFDASEKVAIQGVSGSYAQTFAEENNLEFKEIYDSENDKVEIPTTEKEETPTDKAEDKKEETTEKPTVKENSEFAYNYENNTVTIVKYKGVNSKVVIPETIDNLPVKAISMEVLGKGITTVEIPESVTSIKSDFSSPRYTTSFYFVVAIMALGYIFAVSSTLIGFKKQQTAEGTFYGVPFVYSGLSTYIVITVWSAVALFIGATPLLQGVVAIIIFACALGKLFKKAVARELVEKRGEDVKQKTAFIKSLTVDAQALINQAKTDDAKKLANKVYEAVRYSDPMSSDALTAENTDVQVKFDAFKNAVISNSNSIEENANELLNSINNRNQKCKLLK